MDITVEELEHAVDPENCDLCGDDDIDLTIALSLTGSDSHKVRYLCKKHSIMMNEWWLHNHREYRTESVVDPIGEPKHETMEMILKDEMDWPQYYASGEGVDKENFAPAYYRVEGPNGPVSYLNPNSESPTPTTMYDFAMEAQSDHFEYKLKEETPWDEIEETEKSEPDGYSMIQDSTE